MHKPHSSAHGSTTVAPVAAWYNAPEYRPLWTVVDELAQFDEQRRRSELRPHEDHATRDPEVARRRQRLDAALDVLTQFEIRHGCGTSGLPADAQPDRLLPALDSWRRLIASDSFLRYLNAYLYFGVRMLLSRCFKPQDAAYHDATAL